jgi:hypothetical protein
MNGRIGDAPSRERDGGLIRFTGRAFRIHASAVCENNPFGLAATRWGRVQSGYVIVRRSLVTPAVQRVPLSARDAKVACAAAKRAIGTR